ncbi:NAD(P)H-dependent oxidoreductase subunit E, partial [Streptomyces sp. NPDC047072]|uniref:NAD(P)H-dependent oxidoreductase subunit E n=1 Tax=Streptomyces sp. NPDC047072 TaxID=3154809 RepID=UPI0034037923
MDLRFGDSEPTDDERAAVDALLGPPQSSWEGSPRDETLAVDLRWVRGGRTARSRRDQLLPGLHALNDRIGWISAGALAYLCRRLTVPPAEAYGVATFYAMFSVRPRPATVLRVCTDLACTTAGATDLCASLEAALSADTHQDPDLGNRQDPGPGTPQEHSPGPRQNPAPATHQEHSPDTRQAPDLDPNARQKRAPHTRQQPSPNTHRPREELSPRDRSLITVTALVALYRNEQLGSHLR